MFKISNFTNNNDVQIIQECGPFQVIEYQRDLSVMPHHAQTAYFCSEMNIRKRQVICDINKANIVVQAGAIMDGWKCLCHNRIKRCRRFII